MKGPPGLRLTPDEARHVQRARKAGINVRHLGLLCDPMSDLWLGGTPFV